MSKLKISSDGSTLVDLDCVWREIKEDNPPPSGVRMQLINRAYGSAVTGYYVGLSTRRQFTHYAGFPKFKD